MKNLASVNLDQLQNESEFIELVDSLKRESTQREAALKGSGKTFDALELKEGSDIIETAELLLAHVGKLRLACSFAGLKVEISGAPAVPANPPPARSSNSIGSGGGAPSNDEFVDDSGRRFTGMTARNLRAKAEAARAAEAKKPKAERPSAERLASMSFSEICSAVRAGAISTDEGNRIISDRRKARRK